MGQSRDLLHAGSPRHQPNNGAFGPFRGAASHLTHRHAGADVRRDRTGVGQRRDLANEGSRNHRIGRRSFRSPGNVATMNAVVNSKREDVLNKVPRLTIYFWIIKITATTVGETVANLLSLKLNLGLIVASLAVGVPLLMVP